MNDDYENPDDDDQDEEDAVDEDDDDDKWQQIWTLNRHGPTWRCDVRSRRRNRTCHRRAGLGIARNQKLDVEVTGDQPELTLMEQRQE